MHFYRLRRREFITLLGGAAAWPVGANAQKPAMPVIGLLGTTSREADARLAPFRQALQQAGYVEKQNVAIEYRWAENEYDRFPALAADLVQRQVTVIVSLGGTPGALAAKAATSAIPIVFQAGVDPVEAGIVASLNRPGGNITGVSQLLTATVPKQLQLMQRSGAGKERCISPQSDEPSLFQQLFERAGSSSQHTRSKAPSPACQRRRMISIQPSKCWSDWKQARSWLALIYFSSVGAICSLRWRRAIPRLRSIHGARRQWWEG